MSRESLFYPPGLPHAIQPDEESPQLKFRDLYYDTGEYFTVNFAGLKNIVRYTRDFVTEEFILRGFHFSRAGRTVEVAFHD